MQSMEEREKMFRVALVQWHFDVHNDYVTLATGANESREAILVWGPGCKTIAQEAAMTAHEGHFCWLTSTGPVEAASNVETSMTQIVQQFTIRAQVCGT